MDRWLFVLTLVAALGAGLVAGIFYAFSSFVMKALFRRPAAEGIAAMQSINVVVLNPWFLGVFFGTGIVCAVAFVAALFRWHEPGAAYLAAGSVLYLVGTLWVTIAFNVPRNNALAALAPGDPDAAVRWASYVSGWTRWNHVRTAAALAGAAAFILALAR